MLLSLLLAVHMQSQASIMVHPGRVLHEVSRFLTGACLEDVNHEVYGGIYSQMVFGESFQEPAQMAPSGFRTFGGNWQATNGQLSVSGSAGDRLVSEQPALLDGKIGVDVFADRNVTNAGLIVRVANPGRGVDAFDGYEIALNVKEQAVRLGRHRQNWEPIQDVRWQIPIGRWVTLYAKMTGPRIEVFVNGARVIDFVDRDHPLLSGTFGLRQFQSDARYRLMWVDRNDNRQDVPFRSDADAQAEVSGMWRPVTGGRSRFELSLNRASPFLGRQSQRITYGGGTGAAGIENRGLNGQGMAFQAGKPYEGVLWARSQSNARIVLRAIDSDGRATLAKSKVSLVPGGWRRLRFSLVPAASTPNGRFQILLDRPGAVDLGYVRLEPGPWGRFKGLPVRKDVVQGLIGQGLTMLRYGGSMILSPEYRWKKMIGPRDLRQPYRGLWYPCSTNGWGIVDFLNLCEAAGFQAIPTLNMDETPQDLADFVEYVNGPTTSGWGKRRAGDGHPKPFRLAAMELGNEERIDDAYARKFEKLAEAIWARDPHIVLVVGDLCYADPINDPEHLTGAGSGITSLAAHREILKFAKTHRQKVWFDVHVGTEGPMPDSSLAATLSYVDALTKIADGASFKVVVFELNANNHGMRRALANAIAIDAFERDGRIPVVTSANCLQPDGQNDNGWDQGLLFLNPSHVWLQPPGYVTKMYSHVFQPVEVEATKSGNASRLDVSASRSRNGRTIVLKVVNPTDRDVSAVQISGLEFSHRSIRIEILASPLDAVNDAAHPARIHPRLSVMPFRTTTALRFPARSVSTVTIQ
ncbi:MAG: DUF1080 domain-containing protein [Fimbriimonas sp.]|nr:DUF1080 domain-containing protein [Fimbriimonas sp.]